MNRTYHTIAALTHLLGMAWLVALIAAHVELSSMAESLPYFHTLPLFAFFSLYGLKEMKRGHDAVFVACSFADLLILSTL